MAFWRVLCCLLVAGCAVGAFGQDWASLSGTVVDPSQALVPAAKLTAMDQRRGTVKQATSDESGLYIFDFLDPGDYTLEVAKEGFRTLRMERVRLSVRDRITLRLQLELSPAEATTINVTASVQGISSDVSTGTAVSRDFAEHLPLNGRNATSLVLMAPGAVAARGPGEINVNGLRSNTNYYTMDGVSLEIGGASGGGPGGGGAGPLGGGGGPPGGGAMMGGGGGMMGGGMGMQTNMDSMQEVRVQTSAIAPEFGRTPGAQIALVSRGGANDFHGSIANYFQNDNLNANNWFANADALPRTETGMNRFGATFGGRLERDRTFFFLAFDGARQRDGVTTVTSVPSLATRASGTAALRPYLRAFPVPNGVELDNGAAQFVASSTNPSASDSGSFRIDRRMPWQTNVFLRYSYSRSKGSGRNGEFSSPSILSQRALRGSAYTASAVTSLGPNSVNDLRLNYTTSVSTSSSWMDSFGGATPLTAAQMFASGYSGADASFSLTTMGVGGYAISGPSKNRQEQVNVVDSLTKTKGAHQFKMGIDLRRSTPTRYNLPYALSVAFNGLPATDANSLLSGTALSAVVTSALPEVYPSYVNFSFFGQDTFKATDRTTLTYGLRWDINPAPGVRKGPRPLALSGLEICQVTQTEAIYATRWTDVAPRLGLAYQIDTTPGSEMMFRVGAGMFYDVGYGSTTDAFSGAPYASVRTLTEPNFPLSINHMAAPALPPTRPFGQVSAADRWLKSPVVYQWNATVERWFGRNQSFSLGYVGTKSKRLLRVSNSGGMRTQTSEEDQSTATDFYAYDVLRETTNGAYGDYTGIQAQFRRVMSRNFQLQLSYSLGHSIDTASSDVGFGAGFATLFGNEKGDSDYDIRHNLNLSGSLAIPSPKAPGLRQLFGNWQAEWILSARTALPFEVRGVSSETSDASKSDAKTVGMFAAIRPSLTGEEIWIKDKNAPGGRRLNPEAFAIPEDYSQGNMGRNVLRGFSLINLDLSLRRQISLGEQRRLQILLQAFNAPNHPNFSNPTSMENASTSSSNFGVATRTAMAGGGGSGTRTVQLGLRLEF